jgi:hypothetical protein
MARNNAARETPLGRTGFANVRGREYLMSILVESLQAADWSRTMIL